HGGGGGAILNEAGASLTVRDSSLSDNQAVAGAGGEGFGGGLLNYGTAPLSGSKVTRHKAPPRAGAPLFSRSAGGAIDNFGGATLTVTGTSFTGNQAVAASGAGLFGQGGAIESDAGFDGLEPSTATIRDCVFLNNLATGGDNTTGNGGAIDNQ